MYKTRRAVSKVLSLILKQLNLKAKQKLQLRESWVGCVCVCVFSIFHYHHRLHHHLSLSLSLSNMGSSNSRMESRPSRPPRVNGTNRSNVFSLICGGSSSRATHQVHIFNPKKLLSFTYFFYQYPFRFCVYFPSILESSYSRYGFLMIWVLLNRCQRSSTFIIAIEETCSF